jgi:hypothetical protein
MNKKTTIIIKSESESTEGTEHIVFVLLFLQFLLSIFVSVGFFGAAINPQERLWRISYLEGKERNLGIVFALLAAIQVPALYKVGQHLVEGNTGE